MSTHFPHITPDNLVQYLGKARVNLYVAAARMTSAGAHLLELVNDAGTTEGLGAVDVCRQRLLADHGEASRSVDIAATLITDAWDILDVTVDTYNQMACALIDRTAMLPARAPENDTGMQMYEGVVIIRLAQIVCEILDSMQECLDVPHLPDPYEIAFLPWASGTVGARAAGPHVSALRHSSLRHAERPSGPDACAVIPPAAGPVQDARTRRPFGQSQWCQNCW
jgi:hypothetical protein